MNEANIRALSSSNLKEVDAALKLLCEECSLLFTFPNLNHHGLRVQLWSELFNHLSKPTSSALHAQCLTCIRLLSRDKTELEDMICERWINILVEHAGLYRLVEDEEELLLAADGSAVPTIVEALKCLCNLAYNSPAAQSLCASSYAAEGIVTRLRMYRQLMPANEIVLFDMKLLFLLTALREDIRMKVRRDLHGMTYLVECMDEIVKGVMSVGMFITPETRDESGLVQGGAAYVCNDEQQLILCEMLKIQFNLLLNYETGKDSIIIRLMSILNNILIFTSTSKEKEIELQSNVVNLLTCISETFYSKLIEHPSTDATPDHFRCEGKNVQSIYLLLRFLSYKLTSTKSISEQFEKLSPVMTVLNKGVRSHRLIRIACRSAVLPPLKDVSRPPEEGDSLRSQLCAILTSPATHIRDLVAEFIFVLCKEKVGRMVKYTGYGNAAGLLARKGLLAGGRGSNRYSSSSEDSDTEEYAAARATLDPVTGFCRPQRPHPMEGCSDEQKEYEAMKLVSLLEKLSAQGIVQPARVGAEGRPEPISHLLQLRDEPPHRPQS